MAGEREEAETRWYLYVVSFGEPVNPRRGTSLRAREGDNIRSSFRVFLSNSFETFSQVLLIHLKRAKNENSNENTQKFQR